MGVLNVTPDSFSDGGRFLSSEDAVAHAVELVEEGADLLDVGAESTRPGSDRVSCDQQIARLEPIMGKITQLGVPVSIDTTSSEVASYALRAGAAIINDISAGRDDPKMLPLAGREKAAIVLMHMLDQPKTMQNDPRYENVVTTVTDFLSQRLQLALDAGIDRKRIMLDPGIGFGKTLMHNLELLAGLGRLAELGCAVLVGPSRKRFIGELTDEPQPDRRIAGTLAACILAYERGATVFRVHDVKFVSQALELAWAIKQVK